MDYYLKDLSQDARNRVLKELVTPNFDWRYFASYKL